MRSIHGYSGHPYATAALKLSPLLFVRPGELRAAEWVEFDFPNTIWRIPPEKMKTRKPHLVPLSRQVMTLLQELMPISGHGRYLFPGRRSSFEPMSENTLVAALRRLGIEKGEQTAHGVRAAASTLLNEQDWSSDLIELQLAHAPKDRIRAAYNRSVRIDERRKMMQHWADYLDRLRLGSEVGVVLPFRATAGSLV